MKKKYFFLSILSGFIAFAASTSYGLETKTVLQCTQVREGLSAGYGFVILKTDNGPQAYSGYMTAPVLGRSSNVKMTKSNQATEGIVWSGDGIRLRINRLRPAYLDANQVLARLYLIEKDDDSSPSISTGYPMICVVADGYQPSAIER